MQKLNLLLAFIFAVGMCLDEASYAVIQWQQVWDKKRKGI
jgi:hypothetical protein